VKQIVEFPLENGESIIIEVDEPRGSLIANDVVETAQQTFESALEKVQPVASAIMTKLRSLKEPADEVEVKFGIKMSVEFGVLVASGNTEVNYEITLKWKRELNDGQTS
jgi:hypothetical protein